MCIASEDDCLSTVDKGSTSMSAVLQHRVKSIAVVRSVWKTQGVRAAVDTAISMRDLAVIVDLLNVLNFRRYDEEVNKPGSANVQLLFFLLIAICGI